MGRMAFERDEVRDIFDLHSDGVVPCLGRRKITVCTDLSY